ncbi:MAG: diaminopropionate ammonia-lyase [Gemmatimonadales bacterium]
MNSRSVLVDGTVPPPGIDTAAHLAGMAWTFHHSTAAYTATPLRRLPGLATKLHVGDVLLKDESHRFGLNAFKILGASFAIHRWTATHDVVADAVFTTATDGNHGRAVAWMARQLGFRAVIYMPAHSVPARVAAIQNEGARVILVEEGYDVAVQRALEAARDHRWIVIQDTATDGYRDVPELIAAGYWTTARELEPAIHPPERPGVDVVMLHAGVGTWAAAVAQYYWHRYGAQRPRLVVVEPVEAACLLDSVEVGHPASATGSLRTIMAGLNCGLPSTTAFDALRQSVDAFIAIPDLWAERAMKRLATPVGTDPTIVSGESGAAGVAGLMALIQDPALDQVRRHVGLDGGSRVLAWSTEGATDPAGWERVVGRPVPA